MDGAANRQSFRDALHSFEVLLGAKAEEMLKADEEKRISGAFMIRGDRNTIEETVIRQQLSQQRKGALIFSYTRHVYADRREQMLGVLPTKDPYQILFTIQPQTLHYQVTLNDVVSELKKVAAIQPFQLVEIGSDFFQLRFLDPIGDRARLAITLEKFPAEVISPIDNDYLESSEMIWNFLRVNTNIILCWER